MRSLKINSKPGVNTFKGSDIPKNGIKAYMVVDQHLEDILTEIDYNMRSLLIQNSTTRIRFIRHLVKKLNGNLDQYIDANQEYIEFHNKFVNS